ncbi:protein roadkill-like [Leptopilina heterotoma]|uniref:protein roadkill-like n=1 Tax=Leptopilina heterotoma TaxID=63436 RepID=UPI001CA8D0CE|nr:protein roadkill-like [Leptopilina heterotoma]
MAAGINVSDALKLIGESPDILNNKNINYVALIIPTEKLRNSERCLEILCKSNPRIIFYLIEDGDEYIPCTEFSQTLPNKHYQLTFYQLSVENEIKMNDTIYVTDVTEDDGVRAFSIRIDWFDVVDDPYIYILLKIQEVKSSAEIDIQKNEMSAKFLSLYEEKKLTDFKIICKDQQFCVHKIILMYQSDVFQAMLENLMKKSRENVLVISDFEPKIVEAMIRYLYSDEMTEKLSENEFEELLLIANKYNLEKLQKICFNELLKVIKTFKQAADLIIFTALQNFIDMKDLVIEYMKENKNTLM